MKIRAFDVYRVRRQYCFYLRGMKVLAVDSKHVLKDRSILDTTVDVLHQKLHRVLKKIDERPEYFGDLIAEFNGVKV